MIEIEVLIDDDVDERVQTWFGDQETPTAAIGRAIRIAASIGGCDGGEVGCRLTTDAAIQKMNRDFLRHDYPTDVISFPYACEPPVVQGELVVSVETAMAQALEYGVSAARELLLYVVHGTLHVVGFDDQDAASRAKMRAAETEAMKELLGAGAMP